VTSDSDFDQIVEQYLSRLKVALADVRPERRQQLIESITDHISEARSTLSAHTEVAVRDILDRVGQPEDIAAEALNDQVVSPAVRSTRVRRTVAFAVVVAVAVGLILGTFLVARIDNGTSVTTTIATSATTTFTSIVVPNVVGESLAGAENELVLLRFLVRPEYSCHKSPLPPGVVESQSPLAGTTAPSHSQVALIVTTPQKCP
jgi:beta-lactam-binding protein with PASTA domain